jgi:type II secretory pathway component PulK
MKHYQRLIKNKRGVALFIVLTSMATLAIFLGEITYTAQINQKLAYDRLDNVKATALAKSGFRLALLRIRAYSEIRKLIQGAGADSVVPKEMLEKIWNEPLIIPFSGDLSMLPGSVRDAVEKFRKDSGMEGKLYISIQSQSTKFNLNSYLAPFAPPSPTPTAGRGSTAGGINPSPSSTPVPFNADEARSLLTEQITQTFEKKFEEDEVFRDTYRNLRISDLAEDILAWNDLTVENMRTQAGTIQYKRAPFYDVSELHYLPTVDDGIYNLLAPTFSAGVDSSINLNKIQNATLAALFPAMTVEDRKKFFEFRDQSDQSDKKTSGEQPNNSNGPEKKEGGPFKEVAEFYQWLEKNVAAYNSSTKIQEFKDNLTKRGITLTTEESQFLVHIEGTVNQTKRTLEAIVSIVPEKNSTTPNPNGPNNSNTPDNPNGNNVNNRMMTDEPSKKRSSLKVVQMRFL